MDWNQRRTLAFQAACPSRSRCSARGCFHRACEWAKRCVRAAQSILWQPCKLSHRKVFRAECTQSKRSRLPLPAGRRNFKLDRDDSTGIAIRQSGARELIGCRSMRDGSDGVWSGHSAIRIQHFESLVLWLVVYLPVLLVPLSRPRECSSFVFWARREEKASSGRRLRRRPRNCSVPMTNYCSLSSTDPLTGLANKRVFDRALDWECARVMRMNSVTSLLSIDADHFKLMNDTEGHLRGDECLVALSASSPGCAGANWIWPRAAEARSSR